MHQLAFYYCFTAPSRDKLIIFSVDSTADQYAQQDRYGQAVHGLAGQQRSDDLGQGRAGAGTGRTSEPSSTSAQYGGSERSGRGQTGGFQDPTTETGRDWQQERDDDDTAGTRGGKPTVTSKVKGTSSLLG